MTFIASVIAKNGVALIADSLVTNLRPIIQWSDFKDLLQKKKTETPNNGDIVIKPDELEAIFRLLPSHTKDYEEKLFQYGPDIGILTAGNAEINDKRIAKLILEFIDKNKKIKGYKVKSFEEQVDLFIQHLTDEIKAHIKTRNTIGSTIFILTHYDNKSQSTTIFRISVIPSKASNLKDTTYQFVRKVKAEEFEKVVCDGQNVNAEGLLYGDLFTVIATIKMVLEKVQKDFKLTTQPDYLETLKNDILKSSHAYDGIKMFKLSDLSLQQAVDLAHLLMKIEIDIQKYTENVPTVGGVIKTAVIDDTGFRFISGNQIIVPTPNH